VPKARHNPYFRVEVMRTPAFARVLETFRGFTARQTPKSLQNVGYGRVGG
jgi:hypothetical protein